MKSSELLFIIISGPLIFSAHSIFVKAGSPVFG